MPRVDAVHTESMQHAALCDVCAQRPGDRRVLAAGIETWVCGPCVGDDEPDDTEMEDA
jgi:hypothetical protein